MACPDQGANMELQLLLKSSSCAVFVLGKLGVYY